MKQDSVDELRRVLTEVQGRCDQLYKDLQTADPATIGQVASELATQAEAARVLAERLAVAEAQARRDAGTVEVTRLQAELGSLYEKGRALAEEYDQAGQRLVALAGAMEECRRARQTCLHRLHERSGNGDAWGVPQNPTAWPILPEWSADSPAAPGFLAWWRRFLSLKRQPGGRKPPY